MLSKACKKEVNILCEWTQEYRLKKLKGVKRIHAFKIKKVKRLKHP